jgi:Flp pilus assembly pilin Flp
MLSSFCELLAAKEVGAMLWDTLKNLGKDESGATSVEYAVILALIIVVAFVAIQALGLSVNNSFELFNTRFNP